MKPLPPTLPPGRCLTDIWDDVCRTPVLRRAWLRVVEHEAHDVRARAHLAHIRARPATTAAVLTQRLECERREQRRRLVELEEATRDRRAAAAARGMAAMPGKSTTTRKAST